MTSWSSNAWKLIIQVLYKDQGQILEFESVTKFKYLGSIISDKGSKPVVLFTIVQPTTALTKLKPIWNNKIIAAMFLSHITFSLCLWALDIDCWYWQKHPEPWKWGATVHNMVSQKRTYHKWEREMKSWKCQWTASWPSDHHSTTETVMVRQGCHSDLIRSTEFSCSMRKRPL